MIISIIVVVVVQSLSRVRPLAIPWAIAHQASLSLTISWSLLKLMSTKYQLVLCHPLSQHQSLFQWISFSHQVAKVMKLQLQHQSFQWTFSVDFLYDWLVWSPCYPRDSQESSPTPQFKSINSLVLSLLYGPTLTFIHDYWKNHSFDYTDLSWQSNVSAFYLHHGRCYDCCQHHTWMRREWRYRGGSSLPGAAQLTSDRPRAGPRRFGSTTSMPALSSKEKTDQSGTHSMIIHKTHGGTTNNALCRDKKNQEGRMESVLPRKQLESSQAVPNAKGTRCQVHTRYEWTLFLTMSSCKTYLSPGVSGVKEGSDYLTYKAITGTRDLIWKVAGAYQVCAGESQLAEGEGGAASGKVGRAVFKQLGLWKGRCAYLPSVWLFSLYTAWTHYLLS